jgi:imidazole glycerol-phosphate synthase subunit HisH
LTVAQRIAVIDYGMGNLRSVSKAVEHVCAQGDEVRVTDDPAYIRGADRVVFPGQGAARDCMAAIGQHHLNQAIREVAASKPFLGICMGLQVLLRHSEENGGCDLLNLIPGQVRRFPRPLTPTLSQGSLLGEGANERCATFTLKVPHMGWNRVRPTLAHLLWAGIEPESRFYFVHSYYVDPEDRTLVAGETDYGIGFASAIARGNLFAVQFHPEKSADNGLQLLKNFITWQP